MKRIIADVATHRAARCAVLIRAWQYRSHGSAISMSRWLCTTVALLVLWPVVSQANKPIDITPAEMKLIPAYCKDANTFGYGGTADNMSPNAPKWVAMMGTGFWAIHHYCWALINLMRIEKPTTTPMVKLAEREEAVRDLEFVIRNSPSDFIMLPEIYTKMGEVQLDLQRTQGAQISFAKARTMKRDYWPAYFHWAEFLRASGKRDEARALVVEGLSYSPDAKPLQGLLKELGSSAQTSSRAETSSRGRLSAHRGVDPGKRASTAVD
jgi:tetratricopeptide (TPR) repeat protein